MKKFLIIFAIAIINLFISNPCFAIKIGLLTNVEKAGIGTDVAGRMISTHTNRTVATTDSMKGYILVPYNGQIAVRTKDGIKSLSTDSLVLRPDTTGFVSTKGKWYRGKFLIKNINNKLTLINDIDLENYIKGVVPSEMPASWEYEALKAQAIAARSFALANLGKQAKYGYDLKDNTEDQAYGGASCETNKTNRAVDETQGLVLTYDMKIISAYYSASAGGYTNTNAWGSNLPYLHSVFSFDENIAKNGHGVGMSQHGANNLAKQGYNAYQILQYFYQNVKFARLNSTV
ncbi:MAG: SpoIID/LytB domain-containing protein [Cyanobacteriota bacterium]|nr:SpoIID/LytB domain-containing protein [Cyanobacteriota bacterium]MDY6358706.1 SpoIID/LytB domain-containing protein [Cyanobacteriota bacterium]MDY6363960.1 SpoIID/LytB domain-containing protein [Cyanobacteriota bacterium]MDY6382827.1 SpoIID/LytB domain-containing protein [Cyanobacteriota bacterium]